MNIRCKSSGNRVRLKPIQETECAKARLMFFAQIFAEQREADQRIDPEFCPALADYNPSKLQRRKQSMKTSQIIGLKWLVATFAALGWVSTQAQTIDTWVGPASGGEWNTAANWSTLAPPLDPTTNAVILATTNVNYNLPMTAASFGTLSLYGTLNINTNGFNNSAISMILPGGGEKLFINTGAVVTVGGAMTLGTNTFATLSAGASLTVGSLTVDSGTSSKASGNSIFTNSGGIFNANSTTINNNTGTGTGLFVVNGGTNNLGNTSVGRNNSGAGGTSLGNEGLVIYNGLVTMTNLNLGNAGVGASSLSAYITGGVVTNFGSVFINQASSGRFSRFVQTGGTFVVPDPGVVNPNPTVSGSLNNYAVLGGTNIVGGFFLGNSNSGVGTINITNGATMFIGSQGIANNGAATVTMALNNGGMFGATAPWTGSQAMKLTGGTYTFKTADMNNTANNITLTAALSGSGNLLATGGGILTLNATETYAGNTIINGGTLALGASGTVATPRIFIASGTTFDVSQVSGYTLNAVQTLSGSGTVNGAVTAASTATIFPGSNSVTGTLTFNSGLTENGGANNEFNLSSNPLGPNNDFMNISGGLNLSGTNTVTINGALVGGGAYPLFGYNGNLTGDITNLSVTGASGVFSNSHSAGIIYFVAQSSVRGPTNITWIGNPVNNNWDVEISTNWLNTGTGAVDFFVPNDTTLFSNLGGSNSQVNLPGSVTPTAIIVNTTSNYTFMGNGAIGGLGGVTVSNGTLNVLTTNTYSGPTIFAGGTLLTPNIANSGSPSGIGAATADPGNLIFNGGTFAYDGVSAGTDHGMTLTNAGGTIDVTNGTTLTLNGSLVGNGGLTKVDNGSLVLANANGYTNTTVMDGGTLTVNNAASLGSGPVLLNGGNLAIGAVKPANPITAAGGWISGGNAGGLTGIKSVAGSSNLGIVVTTGVFDLTGDMTAYSGTITFTNAGGAIVRLNGSTGSALATWNLGDGPMDLNVRTSTTNITLGALEGAAGTTLSGRGGSSNNGPTTHVIGANNQNTIFAGVIQDGSGGTSSLTAIAKIGSGTLSLSGANIYTGTTTVSNGVLALVFNGSADGSINGSSSINISAGAILDVSGRSDGTLQLGAAQTLRGRGTINGSVNVGGTVEPGGGPGGNTGTITVTNLVTLSGTAWMKLNRANTPNSDQVVSSLGSVTYGGNLVVTNIGAQLHAGDTFTLFSGSGLSGGTFSSVVLPNYYMWDQSQLGVNGSIRVTGTLPPPALTNVDFSQLSNSNITLHAVNGAINGPVTVLTSTNLAAPISTWTVVTSTTFDPSGNLSLSITVDPALPQSFFILQAY
jgi:fibronectin-binding autotransporter adhesin